MRVLVSRLIAWVATVPQTGPTVTSGNAAPSHPGLRPSPALEVVRNSTR